MRSEGGKGRVPMSTEDFNQEGRHPRAEPRPLAALSLVVPGGCTNASSSTDLRRKARTKERG